MKRRFWKPRTMLFAAVIVILSVGIVFASIPYLQPSIPRHDSVTALTSHAVPSGSASYPGFYALKLNLSASQIFWIGVNVTGGLASFCVMQYQPYETWAINYKSSQAFPSGDCIAGPTQATSQDVLKFSPTISGTWVVVALNTTPSQETVSFTPA